MYAVITLYYNHLVTCPSACVSTTRQVSRGQGLLGFGKGTQEHLGSRLHREWAVGGAQIAPSRSSTPSICSAIIVFIILLCVLEAPSPNHLCASTAWHGSGVYIWVRLSRGAQEEQVQKREGSEGAGGTEQVRVPGARGPRKVREPGPQGRLHLFTNLPLGGGRAGRGEGSAAWDTPHQVSPEGLGQDHLLLQLLLDVLSRQDHSLVGRRGREVGARRGAETEEGLSGTSRSTVTGG